MTGPSGRKDAQVRGGLGVDLRGRQRASEGVNPWDEAEEGGG